MLRNFVLKECAVRLMTLVDLPRDVSTLARSTQVCTRMFFYILEEKQRVTSFNFSTRYDAHGKMRCLNRLLQRSTYIPKKITECDVFKSEETSILNEKILKTSATM